MNLLERAARIAAAARVAEDADRARAQVLAELVGGQAEPSGGTGRATQLAALLDLSRDRERPDMTLAGSLTRITESAVQVLGVTRAAVWFFNRDASALECVDLFDAATAAHGGDAPIHRGDAPIYFATLATTSVLDVADVEDDPATRELASLYLRPRGVRSTLEAPIRWHGAIQGVLRCEHVGEPRAWTEEEEAFVVSLAEAVALALECDRRRAAERELQRRLMLREAEREASARESLPVLELWDGVVAVPLIGALDRERLAAILGLLPDAVADRGAGWILLDLTAAGPLDAGAAHALVRIAAAVRRLGAGCVLSGLPPEIAAELRAHNQALARVPTTSSLRAALRRCLHGATTQAAAAAHLSAP